MFSNDERIAISYFRLASTDQTAPVLAVHFSTRVTSRPPINSDGLQMPSENISAC